MSAGSSEIMTLGILVLGFNRPRHLEIVLESLRRQNKLSHVHTWIDGTQGREEFLGANTKTIQIAQQYRVREVRSHHGHIGIEKMMIDSLGEMTANYDRVLVLEDDCFPLNGAVDLFDAELDQIGDDRDIYSVYGHFFGTEPAEFRDFSRFQGWGWAAHSHRIGELLPELRRMFLMDEKSYLQHVEAVLTPSIRSRLDRTPGRDVLKVLAAQFSWDSATALLTAIAEQNHRRTRVPAVINTGITREIGHFRRDEPRFRKVPFSMITVDEAWEFFDASENGPGTARLGGSGVENSFLRKMMRRLRRQ
jgi:hypothetical protein